MTKKQEWKPTHVVIVKGIEIPVMLIEGAAYQRNEWDTFTAASFECDDGKWTCDGEPFEGTILTQNDLIDRQRNGFR